LTKSSSYSNITLAQTGSEGQYQESQHPKLRCQACSFITSLPAIHCSYCGVNLRTGFVSLGEISAYEAGLGRKIFVGSLAFILILGLAVLFFLFQGAKPPPAAVRAIPITPKNDIEGALDTMQSLSE
jgi:hypothetical protein